MTTTTTSDVIWILEWRVLSGGDSVASGGWGVEGENVAGDAVPTTTPRSPLPTTRSARLSRALASSVLLVFTACHFAPQHVRPPLPTPTVYDGGASAAAGTRAVNIGWRDFFADPRLDALIEAALTHNRDLAASVARIEQARGFYRIQGAQRYPEPALAAGASRSHNGRNAAGLGAASDVTIDRASVNVAVNQFELDFWGRVRDLTESARADYLATVQAQRAFRLSLIQDVASTYLASIETAEQIRLADTTVQSRREGVRIAQVRFRAGLTKIAISTPPAARARPAASGRGS